jgi:murein L,D-transpeptidase YcbB/YkuD
LASAPVDALDDSLAEAIRRELVRRDTSGGATAPSIAQQRPALRRFYAASGYSAAWSDPAQAQALLATLRSATDHGLEPTAYGLDWIVDQLGRAKDASDRARLDVAITAALLRALGEVHFGRIDPRSVGARFPRERRFDVLAAARAAIDQNTLEQALALAAPRWPMYDALRRALARYRELEKQRLPQPIPAGPLLRLGQTSPELAQLHDLLAAFGDLAPGSSTTERYDEATLEAVKRFQRRHGLDDDGIVGPATRAALNVPVRARVRQIELALERTRWLPSLDAAERAIGINVPSFTLWAVGREGGEARVALHSRVIAGRASETRTPLFATTVRGVELNPYWNVPASIARKELVPILRRDPAYRDREDMEIVTLEQPPRVVSDLTAETLAQLEQGTLRLRQRPGEKNALGRLKLQMPNDLDIYLHDTPSRALFARARRDFSHGCIRVERIVELAAFLLEGTEWDAARIRSAMTADERELVRLRAPVPIVLFYTTVMVDVDGTVRFLPDIYRYDAVLDAALTRLSSGSPAATRPRASTHRPAPESRQARLLAALVQTDARSAPAGASTLRRVHAASESSCASLCRRPTP